MNYIYEKPRDLVLKLKGDLGATGRAIDRKFTQVNPETVRKQVSKGNAFIAEELNKRKKCSIIMSFKSSHCSDILDISVKTLSRIKMTHKETQLEIQKQYFKYVAEYSVVLLIANLKNPKCDEDFTIKHFFNFYYKISQSVENITTENQLQQIKDDYSSMFHYYLFNVARQIKNKIYSFILNQLLSKLYDDDTNKHALKQLIETNDFNFEFIKLTSAANAEAYGVLTAIADNETTNLNASTYAHELLSTNYDNDTHPFNTEVDANKIVELLESGYERYRNGTNPPTNSKTRRTFGKPPPIAQTRGTLKKSSSATASAATTKKNTAQNVMAKQIADLKKQLDECNKMPKCASAASAPNAATVSNAPQQAIPVVASASALTPTKPEDYVTTFKANLLEFMTKQIEKDGVPAKVDVVKQKMTKEYVNCLDALKNGTSCENSNLGLIMSPNDTKNDWTVFWKENINRICHRNSNLKFIDFKPLFRFKSTIETIDDSKLKPISDVLNINLNAAIGTLYDEANRIQPDLITNRLYFGSNVKVDSNASSARVVEFNENGKVKVQFNNSTTGEYDEAKVTLANDNTKSDFIKYPTENKARFMGYFSEIQQSQRLELIEFIKHLSKEIVNTAKVQTAILEVQPTTYGGKRRTLKKNKKSSRMNKKRSMKR